MSVYYRKLKSDRSITGLLPAIFAVCALAFVSIFMRVLFKEFMELFLKGEGIRVIDRMDSLKVSVFS